MQLSCLSLLPLKANPLFVTQHVLQSQCNPLQATLPDAKFAKHLLWQNSPAVIGEPNCPATLKSLATQAHP